MTRRTTRNRLLSYVQRLDWRERGEEGWLPTHPLPTLPSEENWPEYLRRVEKGNPELVPELEGLISRVAQKKWR